MEKLLLKLARQLNSLDEASLMSLWEKYAAKTQDFEPSKRWEESVLLFGFIQSMRWKNQLFNCRWAASLGHNTKDRAALKAQHPGLPSLEDLGETESDLEPAGRSGLKTGPKVLAFRPPKDDQPS